MTCPAMKVQCSGCKHWSPKTTDPKIVRLGMACCAVKGHSARHTFFGNFPRECDQFADAAPEIVAARRKFGALVEKPPPT